MSEEKKIILDKIYMLLRDREAELCERIIRISDKNDNTHTQFSEKLVKLKFTT